MGVYSNHRLFTECSWMPNQTWCNSINNLGKPVANDSVDEEVCNTKYYGEDSEESYPIDPNLNNIAVPRVDLL